MVASLPACWRLVMTACTPADPAAGSAVALSTSAGGTVLSLLTGGAVAGVGQDRHSSRRAAASAPNNGKSLRHCATRVDTCPGEGRSAASLHPATKSASI